MTREEKIEVVQNLTQKLTETDFFYITDTGGMSVAEINKFRRICFEKGLEYVVVKNTLIKKALENIGGDYSAFDGTVLKGFSGIVLSKESASEPAKVIKEFRKKRDKKLAPKPFLKGASIDKGLFIGDNQLDVLANIKSKPELIGEVIGLLQSPAANVISALQNGGGTIAGILKTLSEREG